MAVDRAKAITLLGQSLELGVVASALGCAGEYISQLMADESFAAEVMALRAANFADQAKRDRSIDSIEDSLINRLKEAVDSGQIYKPRDILQSFQVVNAAKRRGAPHQGAVNTGQTNIVNLNIPTQIIQNIVTSAQGEVIEADGQTLVTMQSGTLLRQLAEKDGGKDAGKFEKIRQYVTESTELTVGTRSGTEG